MSASFCFAFCLTLRAALPTSRVDDQQAAILQQLLSFDFAARPGASQLLAEPFCKPFFLIDGQARRFA